MGFTPADYAVPDLELWPEHWPVVILMRAMSTQWRMGSSGPIGLDYAVLDRVMRTYGIADPDDEIFLDLQILEGAALDAIHAE